MDRGKFRRLSPSFEVLGGVRGYHVSSRAEGPLGRVAEGSAGWVDPIVGARFRRAFAEKWILGLRGDIGGFGAGSDFAWFFNAVGAYRFSQTFALAFGYRAWDFDRESGSELAKIDLTLSGFAGGVSIHF